MSDYSLLDDATLADLLARHRANLRFLELQKADYSAAAVPLHLHNQAQQEHERISALLAEIGRRTTAQQEPSSPRPAQPGGNPFDGASSYPVGRDLEIQRIFEKLQRGHCSLIGATGSGKSLLIQHLAAHTPAVMGWGEPGAVVALNLGLIANVSQLQSALASQLGIDGRKLTAQLARQTIRLLLLDDLGGMDRGEVGYKMRRWLRGLADQYGTHLVMVSHERLDIVFAADDPNRGSLLAALDTRPVILGPLSLEACQRLIGERLADSGLTFADFSDLLTGSFQPRELLHLCAERYDDLQRGGQ